jgi:release factor glutamine methyltransferase
MTLPTVARCIDAAAARLKEAGIDNPRRETRLLLAHAMGVDQAALVGYPERAVADGDAFFALVERRANGVPMAHILGRREFWSLDFRVTPDTLDPRADSETVVAAALAAVGDRRGEALSVLDLGTGTGCLLLAALSELPQARGTGVDISPAAAMVARGNACALGLEMRAQFFVGDWAAALSGGFDLVLANPPYVARGDIAGLQAEVARYEPRAALDGGEDGLDAYRRIARDMPRLLRLGGISVVEVGYGQWKDVAALFRAEGLGIAAPAADLSGVARCLICHASHAN